MRHFGSPGYRDVESFVTGTRRVVARFPTSGWGFGAARWVALALRLSTTSAQYRLHDATRAVEHHPRLLALVGTGAVSMAGLRRVLAATDVLDSDKRHLVDAQLASDAARSPLTPAQLDKAAQRRVLAADPAAADKRAAEARTKRRCVRLGDPVDGTAGLFARLRAEEALAAFTRLDTLMADLFTEWLCGAPMVRTDQLADRAADQADRDGSGEPAGEQAGDRKGGWPVWRSVDGLSPWTLSRPPAWPAGDPYGDPDPSDTAWDSYLADEPTHGPSGPAARPRDCGDHPAARPTGDAADPVAGPGSGDQIASHPAHGPPDAQWRRPADVQVQVVISAATLLGLDDEPGLLRGHGAVPAEVIRDLVDTAEATGATTTLRGLFCDPADGRLLALDASGRFFTGGLRQFALYRDQQCRLTGSRIVDVDHIAEAQAGGPTTAANSQGLGKLAHVVKDHPDMLVAVPLRALHGDGLDHLRVHAPDICWTTPSGRTYTLQPPPVLGHGSHPHEEPEQSRETSP